VADNPPKQLTAGDWDGEVLKELMRVALRAAQKALPRPYEYEDVEDVAGDAVEALLEKLLDGETIANPAAFVTVVAQRRAIDLIRVNDVWHKLVERGLLAVSPGTHPSVAEARVVEQRLEHALDRLSEQQRTCFVWHHFGGASKAKIATTLKIKPKTADSHLARARAVVEGELN
jgi:RNA polymerase sigma factor (sigma-70 family)